MNVDSGERPVIVGLPAPLDRRMRLGPFPSVRDSLRFLGYAAVGAALASATTALLWLPFLGVGFLLAVYRPDGKALDERAADLLRYRFRRATESNMRLEPPFIANGGVADRGIEGPRVGVLAARGIPLAFLPPPESRGLFSGFQAFLRSSPTGVGVLMTLDPMTSRAFRPKEGTLTAPPERPALAGYYELVRLLCRRRHRRTVLILLWEEGGGVGGDRRLEDRMKAAQSSLAALGVSPERLEGESLAQALARFGWPAARPPGATEVAE